MSSRMFCKAGDRPSWAGRGGRFLVVADRARRDIQHRRDVLQAQGPGLPQPSQLGAETITANICVI
jgi:hypothetical protein